MDVVKPRLRRSAFGYWLCGSSAGFTPADAYEQWLRARYHAGKARRDEESSRAAWLAQQSAMQNAALHAARAIKEAKYRARREAISHAPEMSERPLLPQTWIVPTAGWVSGQHIGARSSHSAADEFDPGVACGEIELVTDEGTAFVTIGAFVRDFE